MSVDSRTPMTAYRVPLPADVNVNVNGVPGELVDSSVSGATVRHNSEQTAAATAPGPALYGVWP